MDKIDEDRSLRGTSTEESSQGDYPQEASHSNRIVPEVTISSSNITSNKFNITGKPASLEILNRVTFNKSTDTPLPTIKGVLNVPIQTDLKFSPENLSKIEDQLRRAFIEFYNKLRLLKSFRYVIKFIKLLLFLQIFTKFNH